MYFIPIQFHIHSDRFFIVYYIFCIHLHASSIQDWHSFCTQPPSSWLVSSFAHTGSFECLLGEDYNDLDKRKEQSLEFQVSKDTPTTFLWHTVTDDCVPVENSLLFFNALRKFEIPVEMHLYPVGGHGLSLANEETSHEDGGCVQKECQSWIELACKWMQNI